MHVKNFKILVKYPAFKMYDCGAHTKQEHENEMLKLNKSSLQILYCA